MAPRLPAARTSASSTSKPPLRKSGSTAKSSAAAKIATTSNPPYLGRLPPPAPSTPHPLIPAPQTATASDTPSTRWECLYVYAFLIKFLPPMVEDMYDATDFEVALMATGFNQIIFDVLERFIEQLLPQLAEPVTPENLTPTLRLLCDVHCKGKIRSVYWSDILQANQNPFTDEVDDFFALPWDRKLDLLRQLVDWQLNSSSIKDTIDLSWEVKYERKKKKTNKAEAAVFAPPDEEDPMNIKNLRMVPLGQDTYRYRYWSVDKSPRVWASTNPWKANCPVTAVCSTPEELKDVIEKLKTIHGPLVNNRRTRFQILHEALMTELEVKYVESQSHPVVVQEAKMERQRQKEEEENIRLIVLEEEEQKKNEISYRTRSRMQKAEPVETVVDEIDPVAGQHASGNVVSTEPSHHLIATSSKSTGIIKAKASTAVGANSKKRKREPSPAPSAAHTNAVSSSAIAGVQEGEPDLANSKAPKGGKARSSTTTSGRNTKRSRARAVASQDDEMQDFVDGDGNENAVARSSKVETSDVTAIDAMPPPLPPPLLDTMELADGRRRSGRASTASVTQKLDAAQIVDRTASSSSRMSTIGSRRSSRLASSTKAVNVGGDGEVGQGRDQHLPIDVEHEGDDEVLTETEGLPLTSNESLDRVTSLSKSSSQLERSVSPSSANGKRRKVVNGHSTINGDVDRIGRESGSSPSAASSARMSVEHWEASVNRNGAHAPESEADDTEATLGDGGDGQGSIKEKGALFQFTVTPAKSDVSAV
ncbi:hypothetical protein FRB97_004113 [Tulasnella sp. 331]|nr:hypothetical protein FRB97_004113 [Tulasnella sp. 331]